MKESKDKSEIKRDNDVDCDCVLKELKQAYRAINALQKTPSHRRIMLDIERKMGAEKKGKRDDEA